MHSQNGHMLSTLVSRCNHLLLWKTMGRKSHTSAPVLDQSTVGLPKRSLKIGVLGAGRIANVHLANLLGNRRLGLQWIVEDNAKRAREMEEQFSLGDVPILSSTSVPQLLDNKELDGVLILTPTPTHTELVCQGLKRGKAVFCEKPVGESVADVRTCYEFSEKYDAPLVVGFQRRWDPAIHGVRQALETGSIGQLHIIKLTSRDSPKPSYDFLKACDKTGCNILSDMAVHDIDTLVWLTRGERPQTIYVTAHAHDPVMAAFGESDTMAAILKFPSGKLACIDVVRDACYGYDVRVEVFGSGGRAMAESPRDSTITIDGSNGAWLPRLPFSFPQRFASAFQLQLQHFVDVIDRKTNPLVTKEECLLTVEIIEKGVQSFKTGSSVEFS